MVKGSSLILKSYSPKRESANSSNSSNCYITKALAATSRLQMKAWHSSTLIPVVLRKMAANSGGCVGLGALAKGESSGTNLGDGEWSVFFSGTRTYLKRFAKTMFTN